MKPESYVNTRLGFLQRVRELRELYTRHAKRIPAQVEFLLKRMEDARSTIEAALGGPLRSKKILEIGPGQKLRQMAYLSRENDVVGIDLDVIAQGFNPLNYWRMFRRNGAMRVIKTLGRKALGIDRKFNALLANRLGMERIPPLRIHNMDATNIQLPAGSFDVVFSYSVFEHLPDPAAVLRECARVLKPGGVAYISLHLFTSDNGCHDPRVFSGNRTELGYWPHLRPQFEKAVRPNAYLNRIAMADWERIFRETWPGVQIIPMTYNNLVLIDALRQLRAAGELAGHTDSELLTVELIACWKKPA